MMNSVFQQEVREQATTESILCTYSTNHPVSLVLQQQPPVAVPSTSKPLLRNGKFNDRPNITSLRVKCPSALWFRQAAKTCLEISPIFRREAASTEDFLDVPRGVKG